MQARHVLGKLRWRSVLLLWSVFLLLSAIAAWLLSWTVELRCGRQGGDIGCFSRSESILHSSEQTFVGRDVTAVSTSHTRTGVSRGLVFETPSGDVDIPIPNIDVIDADDRRAVADGLDSLARGSTGASFAAILRAHTAWRIIAGCVLLFVPLTLWASGKYTVVSVDRSARSVTTQRRLYGLTLTEAALQLDDVTNVIVQPRGRVARIMLRTRHGDVFLDRVPARRVDSDVLELKRVIFG